jgi:hypothetical protein
LYFGESKVTERDFLFALMLSAAGDQRLGIQAGQLGAAARWAVAEFKGGPATLVAVGPRLGLAALVAAALEDRAVGRLELHGTLGSLKEVIEQNRSVDQMPEMFCFGLLEAFDIAQMLALVAPRPAVVPDASVRARVELSGLKRWYKLLGTRFDPLR